MTGNITLIARTVPNRREVTAPSRSVTESDSAALAQLLVEAYGTRVEGEARILEDAEAAAAGEVLDSRHPGATATHDPQSLRLVEVAVRWALHTDVTQQPPVRRELDLR